MMSMGIPDDMSELLIHLTDEQNVLRVLRITG